MEYLFNDVLDTAASRLVAGEALPDIMADFSENDPALLSLLQAAQKLEPARAVIMPSAELQRADRKNFMSTINDLPVTNESWFKQAGFWLGSLIGLPAAKLRGSTKEWSPMSMLISRVILTLVLLVGAAGGTAVAAADSLPDTPLYGIKTAIEEFQLGLTNDPVDQAYMHLTLAQTRIQEMEKLALQGGTPGEATLTRLQNHLETALKLAANAPDDHMNGILTQAQLMLQAGSQAMLQTQLRARENAQEALGNAYQLMHRIGLDIETGLQEPQTFRWRYMHNRPEDLPEPPAITPNPGGVITHTMPITHTPPITTPVQAGPGYGPGEPGGNPESPNGPNADEPPGYGPGEPGYGPGEPADYGNGPGPGTPPEDPGSGGTNSANSGGNSQSGNGQSGNNGSGGGGN